MKVTIRWCDEDFQLKRLVVNSKLDEADSIKYEAARLSIPIVIGDDQTTPAPGDMWIGLSPKKGWGDYASKCCEAGTTQSGIVLGRLRTAKLSVSCWAIEFRNGCFLQNLEADNSGPLETAQTFDSKAATEDFMNKHNWTWLNGGMPKEVYVLKT